MRMVLLYNVNKLDDFAILNPLTASKDITDWPNLLEVCEQASLQDMAGWQLVVSYCLVWQSLVSDQCRRRRFVESLSA